MKAVTPKKFLKIHVSKTTWQNSKKDKCFKNLIIHSDLMGILEDAYQRLTSRPLSLVVFIILVYLAYKPGKMSVYLSLAIGIAGAILYALLTPLSI